MKKVLDTLFSINPRTNLHSYVKTSISLLENFTNQRLITHGTALHAHLIKSALSSQKYIATRLLIMYLKSRKPLEIDNMLKEFNGFNLVTQNCLINANIEWGNIKEARRLFDEMPDRNEVSWTALVSGLLKNGMVDEAMRYFERSPSRDVFIWTAMISGLMQNGLSSEAMRVFSKMIGSGVMPNHATFTSVIKACGDLVDLELGMSVVGLVVKIGFEGNLSVSNALVTFSVRLREIDLAREIFDRMRERDVISWTAILDMYVEMGNLREARRIFNKMPERNEVSWSLMMARYNQSGYPEEAVNLFKQMVHFGSNPSILCYSSVISALASLQAMEAGRNIHGHILKIGVESDVFIGSSLVDLYCKCGKTKDGRLVFDSLLEKNTACWNSMVFGYSLNGQLAEAKEQFDQIPKKNIISWNSMIAGYLGNENFDEALEVFSKMVSSGEQPNKSTFSSILGVCASMASLEKGKYVHAKVVKLGVQYNVYVATALVDMYAKSGDITSSKEAFDRMLVKNEIAWTAMIQGLAGSGFADEALALFEEMERTSSVGANELILSSVLFACSHCGLVDKGLCYFNSMEKVYGVKPNERHYTIVVDMLSRSGRLREAENFLRNMPCEAESNAWSALLSGCKTYGNEEIAERAARKLSELAEKKPGGYVLLSNMYASGGKWHDALFTRRLMNEKGVKRTGGCSWIGV